MILASASPRRRRLMEQMGLEFAAVPADIDESPRSEEHPDALVRRLAATKAIAVGSRYPEELVVGCDTVVALGRKIFGKPRDAEHARAVLQMLSHKRHEIYTGVAVWRHREGRGLAAVDVAHVTFRSLSSDDIHAYILTGEPMDKAGAYAIQGGAGAWVESYEGNLETVIGLPREVLRRLLARMTGES